MNLPVVASQSSPACQICLRSRQFSKYHQNFYWPPWNHVKQNEYPKVQIQTLEGQVSLTLWKLRWSLTLLNCKRSSTASHFTNFSPEKYSQKLSVLSKLCLLKRNICVYNSFTPKDKDTLCGFPTLMYFNPQWCGICAASKASFYSFASREENETLHSSLLCVRRCLPTILTVVSSRTILLSPHGNLVQNHVFLSSLQNSVRVFMVCFMGAIVFLLYFCVCRVREALNLLSA